MSPKTLLRAVAALGVLVVLWGVLTLIRGRLNEATASLSVPRLAASDLDRIEIAGPSDTVRLERTGDRWTVNGAAASREEIRKLMEALADSVLSSELVARNPASHARMGVDTAGRRLVLLSGGQVRLDLVVGNPGAGSPSAYARLADDDAVYRVRGPLGGIVRREAVSWRDRRVGGVPADSVGRIAIRRGETLTLVARAGAEWTVDGAPADTAAVRRLLGALADIMAIGFARPGEADSLDFSRPDRRLTVLSPGADTLLDLLVDSTDAGFRARAAQAADVYQLDFWRVNELTPPPETLRRSEP